MSRWWIVAASLVVLHPNAAAQAAADARQEVLGTIAVQLLRLDGRWLIVSLADSCQAAGCPARPAPPTRSPDRG